MLAAVITGIVLMFYKVPALLTASWVDFALQQKNELKSPYGVVSEERKRLHALSPDKYIMAKTQGKIINLTGDGWENFFREMYLIQAGQRGKSKFGDRISPRDADSLKRQSGRAGYAVPVFFTVDELPVRQWNLTLQDKEYVYLAAAYDGDMKYLRVEYHDYLSESGPMASAYPQPPSHLYYPYRYVGWGVLVMGILLAIILPKPKKREDTIEYPRSRLVMSDIVGVLLLMLFFGLPFLINGGTVQTVSGWWGLSLIFWMLALGPALILYASAAASAFHVQLGEGGLVISRVSGAREYRYDEVEKIEQIGLRNPAWFRKLFFWTLMLSFLTGKGSGSSAGTYFLTEAASYTGFALYFKDGHVQYIWFTDALGNVMLPGYERIVQVLQAHGIPYQATDKVIEKFLPLP